MRVPTPLIQRLKAMNGSSAQKMLRAAKAKKATIHGLRPSNDAQLGLRCHTTQAPARSRARNTLRSSGLPSS